MKQICYYYSCLTFYACMPCVSMKRVNEITKLSVLSIGISINISFHTPVLLLWTYILQQGILHMCKKF